MSHSDGRPADQDQQPKGWVNRALGAVERIGNRLPDPAMLFVIALGIVWVVSWMLSGHEFSVPALDGARTLTVQNQLTGTSLAAFHPHCTVSVSIFSCYP